MLAEVHPAITTEGVINDKRMCLHICRNRHTNIRTVHRTPISLHGTIVSLIDYQVMILDL